MGTIIMAKPQDDQEIYGAPLDLPDTSTKSPNHNQKHNKTFRYKRLVLLLIALLVVFVCIYFFFLRPKPSTPTLKTTEPKSSSKTDSAKNAQDSGLKKHSGDFPRMELMYPDTWTLSKKENGVLIVSPEFNYTTVNKGVIKGNFSVYIRQGAREQEGKYIGRGLAIRPTEKLVYKDPSSTQRKDTNLTLFGLDSSDYFSYFLVSGDYELKKGETLGPTYGREAETYIIAGGFGSAKQSDPLDYNNLVIKDATSDPAYDQAIAIIKSLKVY